MDFTFTLEGEMGRRAAHRERVRGLVALWDDGGDRHYVVHDVSASGLSLVDPEGTLAPGRTGRLTLAIGPRTLLAGLPVAVVRLTGGLAGLAFGELSLRQEAWLDKLVLEIQKRRIDLRKARERADNLEDKKTDRADEKT
ncbi:MAG: PilZ domain-containing protein [Solidesulfovibrio sp.]|uniref:PilZ domain-containing protein n=1 Tax=Solidesulfovibrio sp. TaxID=2910990 RepID=UPI002B1FDC4C|nr:PilZ domain-containing protein [Solidesulfovibrio sp.]MEA4858469.1 PilZ domain-containing protein [Solidesulfovibrio sp.]